MIQSMFWKLVPVLDPNIKSVADGCFGHRLISEEMYDSVLQLKQSKAAMPTGCNQNHHSRGWSQRQVPVSTG